MSVFWAIDASPGEMYLTAAFEEKVAIEAVTHAPVRYNHESVESGHTGFDVNTARRGFYLKSSQIQSALSTWKMHFEQNRSHKGHRNNSRKGRM